MEAQNKEKKEECIELKNIKYKTMLLSGNVPKETTISDNMSNLDKFLENDKINNNSLNELPWSKLDKTIKTVKILQYTEKYTLENLLSSSEKQGLIIFLKDSLLAIIVPRSKLSLKKFELIFFTNLIASFV